MPEEERKVNTTYWYGLFVPIVISILVIATFVVIVSTNVGEPHASVKGIKFGGLLPKIAVTPPSAPLLF
jgi:hypothetical protein